jgi:hypothetical protein
MLPLWRASCCSKGRLVSSRGATIHGETVVMACVAGAFSIHGVVVAGASEAPVLRHLGKGSSKLPSPLDVVRTSST